MDERLTLLLSVHAAAFASRHAHELGVTATDLATWVRRGDVVRVRRSAYVAGGLYCSSSETDRYRLRVRAVLVSRPPDDLASHHAALAVLGLLL